MEIWQVKSDISDGLAIVSSVDRSIVGRMPILFQGERISDTWVPPAVIVGDGMLTDFPFHLHGALLCSQRAWNVIGDHVNDEVEKLEVVCTTNQFFLINVINVIDCIDKSRSQFEYSYRGDVKDIAKIVFDVSQLQEDWIFKTPLFRSTRMYCTSRFRELVHLYELTGLVFTSVFRE